jgi:hypothetical protein
MALVHEDAYGQRRLLLFRSKRVIPCLSAYDGYAPEEARLFEPKAWLRLEGFDLSAERLDQGQRLVAQTIWAGQGLQDVARLDVALIDAEGGQVGRAVPTDLPEAEALLCRRVRLRTDLTVGLQVAPGAYRLRATWLDHKGEPTASTRFGRLLVRQSWGTPPGQPHTITEYRLGSDIDLVGYTLEQETVRQGATLDLKLYWRAREQIPADYTVFVHLLGQAHNPATGNRLWGQVDREPLEGAMPTSAWRPGDVLEDAYRVTVDAMAPPGSYLIEVGLYDAQSGQRLEAYRSYYLLHGGRILLDDVLVEARAGLRDRLLKLR